MAETIIPEVRTPSSGHPVYLLGWWNSKKEFCVNNNILRLVHKAISQGLTR